MNITPKLVDSNTLVELIKHREKPPWKAAKWWQQLLFQAGVFHTYREGNTVADALANAGVDKQHNNIYLAETELPLLARGSLRLDRIGLPNLRRKIS